MENIVTSDQTHTTKVRYVTKADCGSGVTRDRDFHDIDGMITDEPGVVLATFYADCVPLYFVDPVHRAIGLSHSGWRGTVSYTHLISQTCRECRCTPRTANCSARSAM